MKENQYPQVSFTDEELRLAVLSILKEQRVRKPNSGASLKMIMDVLDLPDDDRLKEAIYSLNLQEMIQVGSKFISTTDRGIEYLFKALEGLDAQEKARRDLAGDRTYYEIIGVEPTADVARIKDACTEGRVKYSQLNRGDHDKAMFDLIQYIDNCLTDPVWRAHYDKQLQKRKDSDHPNQ